MGEENPAAGGAVGWNRLADVRVVPDDLRTQDLVDQQHFETGGQDPEEHALACLLHQLRHQRMRN